MFSRGFVLSLLFLVSAVPLCAAPGVVVQGTMGDATDPANAYQVRLVLTSQRYLFESRRGEGRYTLVFDMNKVLLRLFDHAAHLCLDVTEKDFLTIRGRLGVNFRFWERRYLQDEEKRHPGISGKWALLLGLMEHWINSKFEHRSSGVKIGNWQCEAYEGTCDRVRRFLVWTAGRDATGLGGKQEYWFEAAGELCRSFSREVLRSFNVETGTLDPSFKGVPVAFYYFDGSGKRYFFMAKSVVAEDVPDESFEPPPGMKAVLLFRPGSSGGSPQ